MCVCLFQICHTVGQHCVHDCRAHTVSYNQNTHSLGEGFRSLVWKEGRKTVAEDKLSLMPLRKSLHLEEKLKRSSDASASPDAPWEAKGDAERRTWTKKNCL